MIEASQDGIVERSIDLSFDFLHSVIEDPSILGNIPDGATLVLIPDNDPDLAEIKYQVAVDVARRGENVYIRHVQSDKTG
jgi:hypothetical protein